MKRQILFAFVLLSSLSNSYSQTTVTIGTGTIINTGTTYPAPYGNWYWGARQQYLIRASELTASGMSAGNITALAFNVANDQGVALSGFNLALKNTSTNILTNFEAGTTTVYGPQVYTESNGWNTHVFSTPFYWDGVSNLLVSTCFNNTSYTQNAQVFQSTTAFTSSVFYYSDAPNNCAQITAFQNMNQRPNMRLTFAPNNVPPVTNFSVSSTSSCSGLINFFDMSTNLPTSWLWDFGDGNTSTLQNPSHNYSGNGIYTVSLISYNAFGSDTLIMTNYITINASAQLPIASSCIPVTQNGSFGFGITNFNLNTINNSSSDASVGYEDFVCVQTNLYVGQNYPISYEHSTPSTHNSAVWIDFNNDGILDDVTERVFSVNNSLTASGSIYISSNAVLNTPLRLRVWADYDFSNPPSPCGNPDYGQAEDYTVIIEPNPFEPEAVFSVDDSYTCTGTVCFNDQSLNIPTSWNWDFGDGNTSILQFPCHTYLTDGTFDVTLIVTNANGDDTLVFTNAVTVNTGNIVSTPSCTPSTLGYCCGYGIYKVEFNTINNTTNDGVEGYMDFSCDVQTSVTEGQFYNLEVRTGIDNPQDTRVWIDFNNDGIFDVSEMIMDAPNDHDPTLSIYIPLGSVLNTPLRMRVSSDVIGTPQSGCSNNDFGQTEDYAVIILSNSGSPSAFFSANPTLTCNDPIQFTDLSTNAPTSWFWDFGDGITSTQQNPQHTYSNTGTYTVTLIVTNANGDDTLILNNYITIDCNSILMPVSGTEFYTNCSGTVYDNGGALVNYSNNTNGIIVIEPPSATSIILAFSFFDFVSSTTGDTLYVYDGNSISSPLLGAFSGNTMPPNIVSSGGALTLRQKTNGTATDPGFAATWNCILGMEEWSDAEISVYPNPAQHQVFIASRFPMKYSLFDQLGRLVLSEINFSNNFTIDVSSLPNGIYFIEMNGENQNRIMKKIIVQK